MEKAKAEQQKLEELKQLKVKKEAERYKYIKESISNTDWTIPKDTQINRLVDFQVSESDFHESQNVIKFKQAKEIEAVKIDRLTQVRS